MNPDFCIALLRVQRQINSAVPFNATNPFLGNKYANLGAVIDVIKPILNSNGFGFTQLTYSEPGLIGVETILFHESGEQLVSRVALPLGEEKGKSLAQVAGSIVTYLRRYSLSCMLGLYTEEDRDGSSGRRAPTRATSTGEAKPYWPTKRGTLVQRIIKNVPYYGGQFKHIIASLEKLQADKVITPEMTDDAVFAIVDRHAGQQADKAA